MRTISRTTIAATTLTLLGLVVACNPDERAEEIGASSAAISMPACGTQLNEIDGVWAYSNGIYEGTGSSCAGETAIHTLRYQCVEYAQRYMNTKFGIIPVWPVAVAAEMCRKNPAGTKTHWVGDGYQPKHGDLAVWTVNNYGHVAVVKTATTSGIEIVEQNGAWSTRGTRTLPSPGYSGVACFVSADANTAGGGGGAGGGTGSSTGSPNIATCALGAGMYCGGNGGGADKSALYRCSGGAPSVASTCAMGCEWRVSPQNDACRTSATCPNGAGRYCGGNGVSGDPDVLFECGGGRIAAVQRCNRGCVRKAVGLNDVCAP